MKKILIAGANSYIGDSVKYYLSEYPEKYQVDVLETKGYTPTSKTFEGYDVVFCVTGIAHIKETEDNRPLYFKVNRDLVVDLAKAAKEAGVKQFILLSSMAVYGKTTGTITKETKVAPVSAYGVSKAQADREIREIEDEGFTFACLRPPMIYGKGCRGNYQSLRLFALKSPIFPKYKNARSMLYIGNLCEFVKHLIDSEKGGLFFPQNSEYVETSKMVKAIAEQYGRKIIFSSIFNIGIKRSKADIIKKVFGSLTYEKVDLVDKYSFDESIKLTEFNDMSSRSTDKKNIMDNVEYILKHNRAAQDTYKVVMSFIFRTIGHFVKTDDSLVLFTGHGKRFNDSPKAIYQYMVDNGYTDKYKCVWAVDDVSKYNIPGNAEIIKQDTLNYFLTALKAKYWICCVNIERGLHFKKDKTIFLNTWHCVPTNYMGNAVDNRGDFDWRKTDYVCYSGPFEKPIIIKDCVAREESLIPTGLPRNDLLFHVNEEMQIEYKKMLNIDPKKKVILYAPTWRDSNDFGSDYQLTPPIDWKQWQAELEEDYVVLLRTHAYTTKLCGVEFNDFIRDCSNYPEVNDLMIAADIMISDYSSIIFDYAILERPIICYGYDYDEYVKHRGFYFDLDEEFPTGIIRSDKDVLNLIKSMNYEEQCEATRKMKGKFVQYGGDATRQCVKLLFGE